MKISGSESNETCIRTCIANVVSETDHHMIAASKQQLVTESLIHNLIIVCGLPVSVVTHHPNVRQFLHDMDPKYTPPCRQTVTNSLTTNSLLSTIN